MYPDPKPQDPEKSYWPHAIAGLLIGFMAIQFVLIRIATAGFEGPDEVQYYKMGIEFSKEIERRKAQRELGWTLRQEVTSEGLRVRVTDRQGHPLAGKLHVKFKRPATKTQDFEADAHPVGDGYALDYPGPGHWICAYRFESQGETWLGSRRL